MPKDFENLMQMVVAFPDEQAAIDHLTVIRWKNGAFCPHCDCTKVYHFSDGRTHKCGDCRKRFSIKVGTSFEDSKVELRKWLTAIWLITTHKTGIVSTQLAKDIGVTQKTAWFMTQRLRQAAQTRSFNRTCHGAAEAGKTSSAVRKQRPAQPERASARLQGADRMSGKETRNRPFRLDMPFAEALERYIGTSRAEALGAESGQAPVDKNEGDQMLTWQKNLSTTDAQQPTTGSLVPYLRLTSGSLSTGNFQTWFRQTFFDNVPWQAGQFNNKPVEEAHVPFNVTIAGLSLGPVLFTVTHDDTRQDSHNAPNTWLHWPDKIGSILQSNNLSGRPVVLTRDDAGAFSLEIQ